MITLGENFIANISGYIGDLFSDLSPLIFLLVGIFLAFIIIETILGIIKQEK